jgi:sugar phosphate isomerase/epimerase
MKRRSFLQNSTLGAIGITNLSSFSSIFSENLSNIKISITPWSLMRTGYGDQDPQGIDVFDYPAVASSLGFNYIDHEMFHFPPNLSESHLRIMNENCKIAGVKSAVFLTGGAGDIGDANLNMRKKALETYRYWVDVAAALGCKSIRNVCGEYISISHEEKLKYAVEGVNELGEYAASKGLDLLIENHNGYSSDPEWMIALMEEVDLKNVGILGDFTNWTLEKNPETFYPDPYKGIELLAPYIRAVSAKSKRFTADGEETTTDYKRMFKILEKAPNLEFAGVEFFGNEISRNQGVKFTKELIQRVLKTD